MASSFSSGRCSCKSQRLCDEVVSLRFRAQVLTEFGQQVLVVGSHSALGDWTPEKGLRLTTDPMSYPEWSAEVALSTASPAASILDYKFALRTPDGLFLWEVGNNRSHYLEVQNDVPLPRGLNPGLTSVIVTWTAICSDSLPGDILAVVGEHMILGAWQTERGLCLTTTTCSFPKWSGSASFIVPLKVNFKLSWKLVLLRADRTVTWESGENRTSVISFPNQADGTSNHFCISVAFGVRLQLDEPKVLESSQIAKLFLTHEEEPSTPALGGGLTARCLGLGFNLASDTSFGQLTTRTRTGSSGASTTFGEGDEEDSPRKIANDEATQELSERNRRFNDLGLRLCSMLHGEEAAMASARPQELIFWPAATRLPKPGASCEDSYFYSSHALGVADGVGQMIQFAKYGADSAAYASDLMTAAAEFCSEGEAAIGSSEERAAAALAFAECSVQSFGASTACVLVLENPDEDSNQTPSIGVANLGDSGFMLLRCFPKRKDATRTPRFSLIARSEEQQHSWNFPFQLMRLPDVLAARIPKDKKVDSAADSMTYRAEVQQGDLLLMFSDGLVDNLHVKEILEVVNRLLRDSLKRFENEAISEGRQLSFGDSWPISPQAIANALALAAYERSLDPNAKVPFAISSRLHGMDYSGGKQDDITVIASWILPAELDSDGKGGSLFSDVVIGQAGASDVKR